MNTLTILVLFLLQIAIKYSIPLGWIWALNSLFGLGIRYTVLNYLAAAFIWFIVVKLVTIRQPLERF